MILVHKIDELLFDLFPKSKDFGNDLNILKEEVTDYYTIGPFKPLVEIKDDLIYITLDIEAALNEQSDYNQVVALSDQRRFDEAKPILEKLIRNNPSVSDYHRILGQIYYVEGDHESSFNCLIDALKWDPRNSAALIMLANVYAKFKSDFNTAMKYYDKALEINPDDFLAISNIGANLYVADRLEEAERYLLHSHSLNPNFANTSMALAQLYYRKEEIQKSMEFAILAVKNSKSDHPLKDFSIKFLTDISGSYIGNKKGTKIFNEFRQYLEERSGKRIDLELDTTIAMFAKIEIAEYYNRDRHIIKHQKFSAGMEHLLMHELVHLEFILDARQSNANKLFTSNNQNKANFLCDIDSFILKLNKKGFTGETVEHVIDKMFVGLNLQLFNTPIDLFIEDYLFNHFPGLRPVQFFSLLEMYKSYCDGLNIPDRGNFAPALVSEVNVILILVMFYQFTDLYGIDLTPKIKCSNYEKRISKELYNDWLYERYSHIGGSEYDLLEKWGKVLKLQSYFSLIDEEDHLSAIEDEEIQQSIKDDYMRILDKIANDPYNTKDPEFIEHEGKTLDLNDSPAGSMAVTMYCVDAMTTFFGQPYEFIQKVGFEIAALGAYGIDHNDNEKKFHLSSLPDKTFTGLHLLSIMYVAFQHIDPNLNVGVDFRSEFEMAKTLFGNK